MAEPELSEARAAELSRELHAMNGAVSLDVLHGEKAIEVRAHGIGNALVVERVLPSFAQATTVFAMGDDRTDDDLFVALPDGAITVSVGFRSTAAKYCVPTPAAARALLERII
jgi:trehalose 6-phosphate synthase/phosphatase